MVSAHFLYIDVSFFSCTPVKENKENLNLICQNYPWLETKQELFMRRYVVSLTYFTFDRNSSRAVKGKLMFGVHYFCLFAVSNYV